MPLNKQTEFVKEIPLLRDFGYDPLAVYVQATLETGNFTCKLTPHNNFWGMMPRKDALYPSVKFWTHEYEVVDGKQQKVDKFSEFLSYPSVKEALIDYDRYVKGKFLRAYPDRAEYKKYYRGLMNLVDTPQGKVAVYPSFSTSPTYSDKLIKYYEKLLNEQPELAYMIKIDKI